MQAIESSTGKESPGSNVGKWDKWYAGLSATEAATLYGDQTTYLVAASFMADMNEVEDWGCGLGGFRRFCPTKYIGVDGSRTPFADKIVDLCRYRTESDGILLRHVLEHNLEWEQVLISALRSFRRKLCIVLFTPFAEVTGEVNFKRERLIDVPALSFRRADIERHFGGLHWRILENIQTQSAYNIEHVYLIWRDPPPEPFTVAARHLSKRLLPGLKRRLARLASPRTRDRSTD